MSRSRFLTSAAAAALLLALTGCATESGAPNDPGEAAPTGTNRPAETTEPEPAAEPEPEPTPEPVANPKFGETYTWEDGLALTVSQPEPFTPGEWAAKDEAPAYVKFTITVVNGTGENFDPAMVYPTVQSANVEATTVYDSDAGLGGPPSTTLLPGREAVFAVGFGVNDPADLVMEIAPSWDHQPAIFTS